MLTQRQANPASDCTSIYGDWSTGRQQALADKLPIKVSSATIRNEMAVLERKVS